MERSCDSCGGAYMPNRPHQRFCSAKCRVRASRGAVVPTVAPTSLPRPSSGEAPLLAAVRAELVEAERLESAMGWAAMGLAERLVSGVDTGSAVASLTRELRSTLEAAMVGAKVASSQAEQMRDELAERRRRRSA